MRRAAVLMVCLAAGLAVAGCTDAAEPPADPPRASATSDPPDDDPAENRIGYASVFLTGTDVFVPFDVFAPEDRTPFGKGEFFVLGYDCLTEEDVPATVSDLDSATAVGTLALTCGYHGEGTPPGPAEVTGTATVDLTWTGEGAVTEQDLGGGDSSCVGRLRVRHAVVTGSVRLQVPALAVDVVATPPGDDDDTIRQERSTCGEQSG